MSTYLDRIAAIIRLYCSHGDGLPSHDLYLGGDDCTIKWDCETGEVMTLGRGDRAADGARPESE